MRLATSCLGLFCMLLWWLGYCVVVYCTLTVKSMASRRVASVTAPASSFIRSTGGIEPGWTVPIREPSTKVP